MRNNDTTNHYVFTAQDGRKGYELTKRFLKSKFTVGTLTAFNSEGNRTFGSRIKSIATADLLELVLLNEGYSKE